MLFFAPLRKVLHDLFYPTLLGDPVSEHEVRLFSLPARFGGLGISDPVESASLAFLSSREGASVLVDAIRGAGAVVFRVTTHLDQLARVCHDVSETCKADVQSPQLVALLKEQLISRLLVGSWFFLLLAISLTCHHNNFGMLCHCDTIGPCQL